MPETQTLSTHVLDIERGVPAEGVSVALWRTHGASLVPVGAAQTDSRGRIENLGELEPGGYQLGFDVRGYYARQGREPPFITHVSLQFNVDRTDRHYHLPLLLSPFGCTTYRGS